jgi:hypothetical protein
MRRRSKNRGVRKSAVAALPSIGREVDRRLVEGSQVAAPLVRSQGLVSTERRAVGGGVAVQERMGSSLEEHIAVRVENYPPCPAENNPAVR